MHIHVIKGHFNQNQEQICSSDKDVRLFWWKRITLREKQRHKERRKETIVRPEDADEEGEAEAVDPDESVDEPGHDDAAALTDVVGHREEEQVGSLGPKIFHFLMP